MTESYSAASGTQLKYTTGYVRTNAADNDFMRCDIRRRDRRIIFLAGDVDRLVSIVDFHDGIARIPCKLTYLF